MRVWSIVPLRLRSLFRQARVDGELSSELQFHLDEQIRENLEAGMSPAEARAAAVRAFGGIDQVMESCRDTRGITPVQDLARDVRYGLRVLRRSPGFTLIAVVTIALGIGATTAIFSVVNGVMLHPLPYREPDRIVAFGTRWPRAGRETPRLTGGDLMDLRGNRREFDAISAYWGGEVGVQIAGAGEFAGVFWVEPEFFRVYGVRPAAGRTFLDQDGQRGAVVSEGFAERVFGTGARALGRTVSVEDQSYEILGVLPRGFDAPRRTDLWLPVPMPPPAPALNRTAFNFYAVGRLAPGVTLRQARASVDALGARLAAASPDSNRDRTLTVTPLLDRLVSQVRTTLFVLMGAVALVLVIACVNVANLLLARATTRSHEIALRAALGAGRGRIVRQLVAESLLLAGTGGILGIALAYAGTTALVHLAPQNLPRLSEVRVDWPVLAFAAVCSLLASFVFGLAPAWHASRADLQEGLTQAGLRGVVGSGSNRLRNTLVVAEIALSFVLAIGAGLLFRSYVALNTVDLGYRPESMLVMNAHAPASGLAQYIQTARLLANLSPEIKSLPGVTAVATVMGLPTGDYGSNGEFWIEGRPATRPGGRVPEAGFRLASPGYFAALGVPLLHGRDFSEADRHDSPFVAIVSRALAERDFRGQDPIGQRVRCGLDAPDTWMTIVGVVGDVRQDSPGSAPAAELYMPLEQHPYYANEVQVVMRTAVDPRSLAGAVRQKMRALNPAMAVRFTTLEAMVAASIDTPRFRTFLVGAFAALALLLAMAGVYGVMAYVTAQRTPEFGLRVALGAGRATVFAHVVGRASRLAAVGLVLGLLLSVAAGRLVTTMLFELTPLDRTTYAVALGILAAVVLVAAAVPAWHASRVDPVTALRQE